MRKSTEDVLNALLQQCRMLSEHRIPVSSGQPADWPPAADCYALGPVVDSLEES